MPKVGEIWRFQNGKRCYILKVSKKTGMVSVLIEDREIGDYSFNCFGDLIVFDNDHVPFEDIAAILFPEKED